MGFLMMLICSNCRQYSALRRTQKVVAQNLLWILLLCGFPLKAQQTATTPVMTAENINDLQPVEQIDFTNYVEVGGEILSGWFVMNDTATRFAFADEHGAVFEIDDAGRIETVFTVLEDGISRPGSWIDGVYVDDVLVSLHVIAGQVYIGRTPVDLGGQPLNIGRHPRNPTLLVELLTPENAIMVVELAGSVQSGNWVERGRWAYKPADDPDALIRIGRIPFPYVVTSSEDGVVKLWDLSLNGELFRVQVEGGPAVFGQLNNRGTRLAWRDPQSQHLNLLHFLLRENRIVAPLNGNYVQWFFVSDAADVILGVDVEAEPLIVAWDVASGERITLGEYRECGRVADMARFSRDGTALVIGCDTGLEIWRVSE